MTWPKHVVWVCHLYPPDGAAGAEWMAHHFMRTVVARGGKATVLNVGANPPPARMMDGVRVVNKPKHITGIVDVVIGHLGNAHHARRLATLSNAAFVWMAHAPGQYQWAGGLWGVHTWLANSLHVAHASPDEAHTRVLSPVVDPGRVCAPPGSIRPSYNLLVNASQEKGGDVVQVMANAMRDHQFVAVRGAYGRQIASPTRNLLLADNTPDMRGAYGGARVVLIPSVTESWSMVAVEAGMNGLPVVATECAGIRESMGDAPVYVPARGLTGHRAPAEWIDALRQLDDPNEYRRRADLSRRQAEQTHTLTLQRLTDVLEGLGL